MTAVDTERKRGQADFISRAAPAGGLYGRERELGS
jgi:hypothetical protein